MRITQYQLEKELEAYKSMMEAIPQSMFLLDKNKNIIGIFNVAPETLAGVPIEDIVGHNILLYVNNPESPFHQACTMLNTTFDSVFKTGVPLKFQYMIFDIYLEATITKISGERILSQVRDITDIVMKQQDAMDKKHNELAMALMAGGLTSWSYDVQNESVYSKQDNNVIGENMSLENLLSLIQPGYRQKTLDMFDDIIKRGCKSGHVIVPTQNRDGIIQWSDVHAIPHEYGPNGEVTLIIGSQKDISKEYEHNEKLKHLILQNELILNNTDSGFAYLTLDLKVEWENISSVFKDTDINNLFRSEPSGNTDFSQSCCRGIAMQARSTKNKTVEKFKTAGGMIVEVMARPVLNDTHEIEGIVLRLDDITLKEETLCELARAKERAEQSDKLKSAFLANMSHEIRTPLNSIVGFSQLIPNAETEEEQQRYTSIVNANSEILLNLLNDILDLSKIEAGYFNCNNTRFNLPDLFAELEFVFKYRKKEGVELICDMPGGECFVNLDRVRVSQIISNFMTNAIKFTKQGYIKMGFEILQSGIKLFVEDSGCGMSEDETKRVFERFEKFNIFEQGTGLGTSIAKAVVDAYNGEIGVVSEFGKGSTFWAFLPTEVDVENVGATSVTKGSEHDSCKKIHERDHSTIKILIAEDNDSNYMLAEVLLKNYDLTRAYNGQEAVKIAQKQAFDIILMDIQMPVMDGVEATGQIRNFNTSIPIIAVTANAFDEDKRRAFEAGVNDFLTKPLTKAKLIETINQY